MEINVGQAISELMYETQSVVVPGFGSFSSSYKPSVIDHVQGMVEPPSKSLEFNEDLIANDGVLVKYLQESYAVSPEDAEKAVKGFVRKLNQSLENREIVEIPKVGRLYRDYEQNLKYLPESTNFNTESFGLPSVQFYPVLRDKKKAIDAAMAGQKTNAGESKSASRSSKDKFFQKAMPWLLFLAVLTIGLSFYLVWQDLSKGKTADKSGINVERLNKKPGLPAGTKKEVPKDDPEDLEDFRNEKSVADDSKISEDQLDDVRTTISPNQKEAFIVLHSFGVSKNAKNFIEELSLAGFNPHSIKDGRLMRVGILQIYEKKEELDTLLVDLGKKYKTTPVVWKK